MGYVLVLTHSPSSCAGPIVADMDVGLVKDKAGDERVRRVMEASPTAQGTPPFVTGRRLLPSARKTASTTARTTNMRAVWPQSDLGTLREMRPNMFLPTKLSVTDTIND